MKKMMVIALFITLCASSAYAGIYKEYAGRKVVTAAGTAEVISSTQATFHNLNICAETDNTGAVVIGPSTVVASLSTRTGVPLLAGDCVTYGGINDMNGDLELLYVDSTVSGDGITYEYRG